MAKVIKASKDANDATRSCADVLFTKEQLKNCSVRGRHTYKKVEKEPALPRDRLAFISNNMKFPNTSFGLPKQVDNWQTFHPIAM